MTALDDLKAAQELLRAHPMPPLPEAYLHDREHLAWLALVAQANGRRPFYESPDRARDFGGIPIFIDPAVPANVLELRHPDGRVERIDLTGKRAE